MNKQDRGPFEIIQKRWARPVREASGYYVYSKSYGYYMLVNVLGFDKNELCITAKVSGKDTYITIDGTAFDYRANYTFKVHYELIVHDTIVNTIDYSVNSGLLHLYIYTTNKEVTINDLDAEHNKVLPYIPYIPSWGDTPTWNNTPSWTNTQTSSDDNVPPAVYHVTATTQVSKSNDICINNLDEQ